MRDLFEEVLSLQPHHAARATPAMQRRGALVRREIPDRLRARADALRARFGDFRGRLAVQGSDGRGAMKAHVPWVRLHNPELSPSAQAGWYVTYLFRPDGEGVSMCVSHGAARWDGRAFVPRPPEETARLMRWARARLAARAAALGFGRGVELDSPQLLARAYEKVAAFSKGYARGAVPSDEILFADAGDAAELLGRLYRAEELGRRP